ncbi:hypothetical protein IFR04_011792 [Cadophora malorum]|uniref:Uncharacterized protein n=1 Tax=Cadophora malorum TaxID=108018 RepID=A0A8H7T9N2_9HELO|nr:hypothetical protein IFR04_011792 [Cadophora malorum]
MATRNLPPQPSAPSVKARRSIHIPNNKTKLALKTTTNNIYHNFDSDTEAGGVELAPWTADEIAYGGYKIQVDEGKPAETVDGGSMSKVDGSSGDREKMGNGGEGKDDAGCGEEERKEKDTGRG